MSGGALHDMGARTAPWLLALAVLTSALLNPRLQSAAVAQDTCPGGGFDPTPTELTVDAVPIVVTSTTNDYFVLYVTFDVDGTELQVPIAVTRGAAGTTTLSENLAPLPAERYRVEQYQIAEPADVDGDCIDDITELANLGSMNPVNPAMISDPNDGVVAVPDLAAFRAQGTTVYRGTAVKFVLLNLDSASPAVYFMNTKLHQGHNTFFEAVGLQREGAITGTITYDPAFTVPGRGVTGFYYEYFPRLGAESFPLAEQVHTVLTASLGVIDDNLTLYIPHNVLPLAQERLPLLRASRIPLAFDPDIYGDVEFLALNTGTGYGRLRILEADERPHPRDIIVSATLPNELPRVAGILTATPQTPLSHVNLRAVQDSIPNAYVKDVLTHADVISLEGSYVRYEVTERQWELRAATLQEVETHYESSRPAETQTPERDLSITEITDLDQIGFDDWRAFGVKAANLAVLRTLRFPEGTVRDGFAIPFYFYAEFMKQPLGEETVFGKGSAPAEEKLTLAADTTLIEAVEAILAHPKFQTDLDIQDEMLDDLRDAIKDAQAPQWIIDALTAMHDTFPAETSLRYRSSTNNEDLPGFNGAGLYDSKTQHPEETEEDGIDKSFKQVLAGLWTFRAFSEREFHRVDHLAAAMGVLVHPNFSNELVNGVAVSFDPDTGLTDRYYVNSQLGEDLVTNPEAHSVPEEIVLLPGDSLLIRGLSNLVEPGELLMSYAQMRRLREHLGVIRDHFKGLYNPAPGEPFAMEIEFKITSENILAIKQARPWVFGEGASDLITPPVTPPVQLDGGGGGGGAGRSGGGGGGGGGSSGPTPSKADYEWTVKHDIEALDGDHGAPTGMWSDGAALWLLHNGDGADDAIYAYDIETGERVEDHEFELDERNRAPRGVWSDRTTMWVSDSGQDKLFAYDLATGARRPEADVELTGRNADARGIWSDGETVWVLDERRNAVFAYDLESGALLAEYALDSANGSPRGLWSDGVTLWVSDPGSSPRRLFAYRLPTREEVEAAGDDASLERVRDEDFTELSRASNNSPRGIWADGDVMYVADASDGKVYTYNMPDAIDARLASLTLSGIDIGEFDPERTDYEGAIATGMTETTVEAGAVQRHTDLAIDPPDADGDDTNGHQVALAGVTEITIAVTSADGTRTKTYRVSFEPTATELALSATWTSFEWPGPDGLAIDDARVPEEVVVIYAWDEVAGRWLGYFPGLEHVPGLNTLSAFLSGTTYWIAAAEAVTWTPGGTEARGQ